MVIIPGRLRLTRITAGSTEPALMERQIRDLERETVGILSRGESLGQAVMWGSILVIEILIT